MFDKEYAVNMFTAIVDAAEEMNEYGIKARCLSVNGAVFDTIRGLIPYLQNSEEVVRCEYCKHNSLKRMSGNTFCDLGMGLSQLYDFCSKGERKDDAVH